jgi:hypothetical protein
LLPWRTRLKSRLENHSYHEGDPDGLMMLDGKPAVDPSSRLPSPPLPPTPSENPVGPKTQPAPAPKAAELQLPATDLSQPEPKRPDLAMQ